MPEEKKDPVRFRDKEVEAKYATDRTEDVKITFTGYHGMLSKITFKAAEYLVSVNDPNIREKATQE